MGDLVKSLMDAYKQAAIDMGKDDVADEIQKMIDAHEATPTKSRILTGSVDEAHNNEKLKGLKEDMDLNFDRTLLDKWIDDLNAKGAKHHQTFSYTEGGKYIRVFYTFGGRYDNAVFAFVDADGNIYKPAGWKTPAKGVRARIDQNPPLEEKDLYSARYRAAVYGESKACNEDITDMPDNLFAHLPDGWWNRDYGYEDDKNFNHPWVGREVKVKDSYYHPLQVIIARSKMGASDHSDYIYTAPVDELMGGKIPTNLNKYHTYDGYSWNQSDREYNGDKGWEFTGKTYNIGKKMGEELLTEKPSPAGYEPTKKGIAYKVFKVKNGKLYPPMVANAGGADTPIGVWLDAEEGEFAGLSKTGRPQVKSTGSGNLSYRPGWHLGDIPRAKQFDRLNKETGEYEFPKDFVWAECEYAMDVDYQPESDARGYERTKVDKDGNVIVTKSDKYQHSLAGLPKLPTNGYYKYRTNPNPDTVPWVITGQMKVNRLLSDAEVNAILEKNGIEPIHRQGGDKTLAELGLKEGLGEDWYFHDDDSYFSHEQLLDFASDLEDAIQARHGRMFSVTSVWFEKDNSLVADVQIGKYGDDMLVSQKVDMRRVKTERDLRKYIPTLVDQVTKQAVDDNY